MSADVRTFATLDEAAAWFALDPSERVEAEGLAAVRGGTVRAYVQSFCDELSDATGAESFGTYPGHDPSLDLAVDIFTPIDSRTLGDAICAWTIDHLEEYSGWYLIYRRQIFNPLIGRYWRDMSDRGSPTANHMDHVHLSFLDAAPKPKPKPEPVPQPQEVEVAKIAYPVTIRAGEARRIPVPAIGGGFGWTKVSVTYASAGVRPIVARVGPNSRPITDASGKPLASADGWSGRHYVDLEPGDEWVAITLHGSPDGTLELMVEASDA